MTFSSVALLLLLQVWLLLEAKPIDPSRLLVATVIDGSNEQIVSDSHFFFRSIRLFGGSLNDAVLLACIVLEPGSSFINDNLLIQYSELGIEVDFIRQTPAHYPKTLNKFASFYKYDPNRFDHFLWLDADIFVFGDPLVLLPDLQAGRIWCVPEVYNYMKRFGRVNHSDIMWNPSLPPFRLVQEDISVPHGVCNTGVILFDSVSLRLFLQELFRPNHLKYFNGYTDDRFIDSLAFVIAVNAASIYVEPLDYIFNFMAFFELTLHSFGFRSPPVMAHFIHDTSLLFNIRENDGSCYAMYQCTHLNTLLDQQNSMVGQQIVQNFGMDPVGISNCMVMAKQKLPTLHIGISKPQPQPLISKEEQVVLDGVDVNTDDQIRMLWPLSESQLFVTKDRINIEVIIEHHSSVIMENSSEAHFYFQVLLNKVMAHDGAKEAQVTTCFEIDRCRSLFIFTYIFDISIDPSLVFRVIAVFHPNDMLSLSPHHEQNPRKDLLSTGWKSCSVIFQGFAEEAEEAKKSSRMGGGQNPVRSSALPIALSSQLELSQFLNLRRAIDVGIVLCCDTLKGVETTKNLIRSWGEAALLDEFNNPFLPTGGILLISLQHSPLGESREDIIALETELSTVCKTTSNNFLGGCVISRNRQIRSVLNEYNMFYRENFLSFVYSDLFESYHSYEQNLCYWYSKLATGGIMIGSRYHMPPSQTYANLLLPLPSSLFIKSAIDSFVFSRQLPLLLTYAEGGNGFSQFVHTNSSNQSAFLERLPAWYVLK